VPMGYLTVTDKGIISEANLTAAAMLGTPRYSLLNLPMSCFMAAEDRDKYYNARQEIIRDMMPRAYEWTMTRANGKSFRAWVQVTAGQDRDSGMYFLRLTLSETDMKG